MHTLVLECFWYNLIFNQCSCLELVGWALFRVLFYELSIVYLTGKV